MADLRRISCTVLVVGPLLLEGCAGPTSDGDGARDWAGEGQAVFGGNGAGGGAGVSEGDGGWGILLESYSGSGHVQRARQRRDQVARSLGREDVTVQTRSRGSAVVLGSYAGPDDPRAQRDLEWVQSVVAGGRRPYERSYLAPPPPPPADLGNIPELNLLSAKRLAGPDALYTFQVGVFESSRRERAKRAAEAYALELRRQGEMAFYYHGPTKSMVTIGIFGKRAYDTRAQRVSLEVQALQRRFPQNVMMPEPDGPAQPSMLVLIPK